MKIRLHQNQGTVFLSSSRFKVIAAGRRWGKTVLACAILFTEAVKNDGGIYWLCAPTFSQAKELAWSILIKMIPAELLSKKNETELSFVLKNGAEIHLKGADCDPNRLRGRGLRGLIIDEVATIRNHKSVWEEILRPSLSDYQGFCVFISTPKGKDYFWELWCKGQRKEDGYESWQFPTEDNPHIPRSEIKAAQSQLSDRFFKQEYLASFEDYTGLIYPEYSEKVHVIDPFEIPEWWEKLGAIDPAITGTTGALFARIDQDGVIYITGEYYEQDKRVSEVAEALRGKVSSWVIDPAAKKAFSSREGKLYTLYDEYTEHLGNHVYFGENDVNGGINRVAEFLKAKKIRIFRTCKNLLWELERYHWAEQEETVGGIPQPKPYKANDHLCDALRYLVMARPAESKYIEKPKPGTHEFWDEYERRHRIKQGLEEEIYELDEAI